jgi:hypothetical protein
VLRDETEWLKAVEEEDDKLVGTNPDRIVGEPQTESGHRFPECLQAENFADSGNKEADNEVGYRIYWCRRMVD